MTTPDEISLDEQELKDLTSPLPKAFADEIIRMNHLLTALHHGYETSLHQVHMLKTMLKRHAATIATSRSLEEPKP